MSPYARIPRFDTRLVCEAIENARLSGARAFAEGRGQDDNPHLNVDGERLLASVWARSWKHAAYHAMTPEMQEGVIAFEFKQSGLRGDALRRAIAESMGNGHADLGAKAEAVERIAKLVENT